MNTTIYCNKKKIFGSFLLFMGLLMFQCARVTSPTGGPKDEIPPVMISSNPGSNTTNFKEKEITLTISDMNESLPADNLRIAFSTGPEIDSLKINGQIFYLLEDRKAENITVALYASDTFNIFKHTPLYFTKTDKKGRYSLQNLKSDNYYVYAFDDKNKNLKVDSKSEYFDFTPNQFLLKRDTVVFLSLFKVNASAPKVSAVRNYKNLSSVSFNKPLDSIKSKLLAENPILTTYGDSKNELLIYHDEIQDSVKLNIQTIDSLY